ncbi:hypothetical protein SteCoe_28596 [Stentor coeruleus]|uniref:Uncharacterized protein n=1 Tax=Stentor coeruleus TaxID=5963 RepID=A0A1R2B7Y4_9CILI|nr:hypothetical protein SteCoe_28596 [Stentor coeruleus]
MGCSATRSSIINNLVSLSESLESEISELKNSREELSSAFRTSASDKTFIFKDLLNMKSSFKNTLDQTSLAISEIQDLPQYRLEIKAKKESQGIVIAESLLKILKSLVYYENLVLEKKIYKEKTEMLSKEILDSKENKKKCEDCYDENSRFLNDNETYKKEVSLLEMQKEELEEQVSEQNNGIRSILSYSKSKIEDRVGDLNEDDARKELALVSKRVKGLKDIIEMYRKGSSRDIGLTFGKHEKQERAIRDYNNLIKIKKEKIVENRARLHDLREEIEVIEKQIENSEKNQNKFSMINSIIQKCRIASRKGDSGAARRLVKKKTFLDNVEETVTKARVATVNVS